MPLAAHCFWLSLPERSFPLLAGQTIPALCPLHGGAGRDPSGGDRRRIWIASDAGGNPAASADGSGRERSAFHPIRKHKYAETDHRRAVWLWFLYNGRALGSGRRPVGTPFGCALPDKMGNRLKKHMGYLRSFEMAVPPGFPAARFLFVRKGMPRRKSEAGNPLFCLKRDFANRKRWCKIKAMDSN